MSREVSSVSSLASSKSVHSPKSFIAFSFKRSTKTISLGRFAKRSYAMRLAEIAMRMPLVINSSPEKSERTFYCTLQSIERTLRSRSPILACREF